MTEIDLGDLQPIEVPYKLGGKSYILKEASGDAVCKYRNALMKSAKMGDDLRVTSVDGIADVEPLLVSLCLFEVTEKGHRPVSTADVRAWPNRVQKALFEKVKEISDLEDKEAKERYRERVKNGSSATMDGSI